MGERCRHRAPLAALVVALLAFSACGGGGCEGGEGQEPEEAPIPRRQEEGPRVIETLQTNYPMTNAAVVEGPGGRPTLVATLATAGRLLTLSQDMEAEEVTLSRGALVGLYPAGRRVLTLESSGRHLLVLGFGDGGALVEQAAIEVGDTPRVVEVLPSKTQAWVLARGEARPLVRVDLEAAEVVVRAEAGQTPTDLELDPKGRSLYVSNIGSGDVSVFDAEGHAALVSIPVGRRPLRLFAAPAGATEEPNRIYALHANSRRLTAIDTAGRVREAFQELEARPSALAVSATGRYIYALAPGAGKLMVVDATTLGTVATYEVPVGSSDIDRVGEGLYERVLVSTAERGELLVFRVEGESLRRIAALPLGAAAGRIATGGLEQVWMIGPRTGRVGRFDVK